MDDFSVIDYILCGGVAFGALAGFVRGLTRELARTICYAVSAAAAWYGCVILGDILVEKLNVMPSNRNLLAFILIFVGSYVILWGVRLIGRSIAQFEFRPVWEKLGGLLLGSLKNAVGLTLILLYTAHARPLLTYGTLIEGSHFGQKVENDLLPRYEKFAESHPEWYRPPLWTPLPTDPSNDDAEPRDQRGNSVEG